jgi:hypothetical protein
MASKPIPTRQFLNNPAFQEIHQQVARNASLLKKIKAALPGAISEHCLSCVARDDGLLVVYTDSQAFASQLRFHAPLILARLSAAGDAAIRRIAIRNLASIEDMQPVEKTMAPMKKPSTKAIEAVKATGRNAAVGDELSAAMAHLGATMERYAGKKA